jgi:hypothetical protein
VRGEQAVKHLLGAFLPGKLPDELRVLDGGKKLVFGGLVEGRDGWDGSIPTFTFPSTDGELMLGVTAYWGAPGHIEGWAVRFRYDPSELPTREYIFRSCHRS